MGVRRAKETCPSPPPSPAGLAAERRGPSPGRLGGVSQQVARGAGIGRSTAVGPTLEPSGLVKKGGGLLDSFNDRGSPRTRPSVERLWVSERPSHASRASYDAYEGGRVS